MKEILTIEYNICASMSVLIGAGCSVVIFISISVEIFCDCICVFVIFSQNWPPQVLNSFIHISLFQDMYCFSDDYSLKDVMLEMQTLVCYLIGGSGPKACFIKYSLQLPRLKVYFILPNAVVRSYSSVYLMNLYLRVLATYCIYVGLWCESFFEYFLVQIGL